MNSSQEPQLHQSFSQTLMDLCAELVCTGAGRRLRAASPESDGTMLPGRNQSSVSKQPPAHEMDPQGWRLSCSSEPSISVSVCMFASLAGPFTCFLVPVLESSSPHVQRFLSVSRFSHFEKYVTVRKSTGEICAP